MVTVVYIDVLFIINFIVNYLVLFAAAKLNGAVIRRLRIALSAAVGALYCCVVFFIDMGSAPAAIMAKIAAGAGMVLIAFGAGRAFLRLFLSFCGVSFAFGGCVLAAYLVTRGGVMEIRNGVYYLKVPLGVLLAAAAVCFVLMELVFKRCVSNGAARQVSRIHIEHMGKSLEFHALVDTGNNLTDPLTNAPVIIAEYDVVRQVLDERVKCVLDTAAGSDFALAIEKLPREYRFRLLPYKTVGRELDMLLAFQPDAAQVGGKKCRGVLVAISPNRISDGGAYNAITGAAI